MGSGPDPSVHPPLCTIFSNGGFRGPVLFRVPREFSKQKADIRVIEEFDGETGPQQTATSTNPSMGRDVAHKSGESNATSFRALAGAHTVLSRATRTIFRTAAPIFSDRARNGQEVTVPTRLSEARFLERPTLSMIDGVREAPGFERTRSRSGGVIILSCDRAWGR